MPAATTTRSTITRIGQATLGVIAAATLIASGPGTATAATSPSSASPSRPLQVSSCQGKLTGPEKAGPVNINFSSWTLCFGDVVWIHTYVELQRYAERRDGWEWVTVAGPREKSYPGVTGGKVYNNQWVSCPEAGGSGRYREAGWAKWANSEGEIGTTYHAYKTAKIEC